MVNRASDLKAMRLDKRLTQAEVAAKMGVSQAYYSLVETGNKNSDLSQALMTVSKMRSRSDRTAGGTLKAGRVKP